MSEQLQLRRGTSTQIAGAAAPAQGELWIDTTTNRAIVGDGTTVGGHPAARLDEVIANYRTAVGNANYSALAGDRTIAFTSISANRTVSLPAASAFPTGTVLTVLDESGAASGSIRITLQAAGADLINGGASAAIASAYGYVKIESDGISRWTIIGQPPGGGTGILAPASGGLGVSARSAPFRLAALAVNANVVGDTSIAVPLPTGLTRYRISRVTALNPTVALSAAQAALYTASAGGGVAIASPQALAGLTTNSPNSAGNAIDLTLALAPATFFAATILFFRVTTAQGSAAALDVVVQIEPY